MHQETSRTSALLPYEEEVDRVFDPHIDPGCLCLSWFQTNVDSVVSHGPEELPHGRPDLHHAAREL